MSALTVIVVALAAAVVGVMVLNLLALEPRWLAGARHALAEARHRAGGVLEEFGDWLRLGR